MDVDCSKFTYDTPASSLIQTAAEKAQREMNEMPLIGEGVVLDRTETQEEVLSRSLLKHIDEKTASEDDILEAYCRDVDAYSFDLNDAQQQAQQQNNLALGAPRAQQTPMVGLLNILKTCFQLFCKILDPDRPPACQPVPRSACAVVYDEKNCASSWKLIIPMGELRFKWMSQYYAYR